MENKITSNPGVYLLRNKINNKIYIGKAANIWYRIRAHKYYARIKKNNQVITRAITKYGWENFEVEILESFDKIDNSLLLKKESEWIIKLNATNKTIGYNVVEFGTDCTGIKQTEEHKRKVKEALTGKYAGEKSPYYKVPLSEEHKKKIRESQSKYDVQVKQIDIVSGQTIKIWNSARDAAEFLTGKRTNSPLIGAVCNKYVNKAGYLVSTAYGYKWSFEEGGNIKKLSKTFSKNESKVINFRRKQIKQIDPTTNKVIRIWNSSKEAAQILGGGKRDTAISGVLNKRVSKRGFLNKTAYGFKWEFVDQKTDAIKDPVIPGALAAHVPVIFP